MSRRMPGVLAGVLIVVSVLLAMMTLVGTGVLNVSETTAMGSPAVGAATLGAPVGAGLAIASSSTAGHPLAGEPAAKPDPMVEALVRQAGQQLPAADRLSADACDVLALLDGSRRQYKGIDESLFQYPSNSAMLAG